jgi:uncharacterized protein (DUF2062 family)
MRKRWKRATLALARANRRIVSASGATHQIALGASIGFFFGVLPIPVQYLVAALVRTGLMRLRF